MRSLPTRRAPLAAAGVVLALGVGVGGVALQSGASAAARPVAHPTVAAAAHSKSGHAGWQGTVTYTPQVGTNLFFHYGCPTGRIATNGGFTVSASIPSLINNSARADISPKYAEWGWTFVWPGGAPSDTTIEFNVYCQ